MSTNSFLGHDVDLERLAELTRNFSGAEIEGLVKSAASYALNRNVDINDLHKPLDEDNIKVCMHDVCLLLRLWLHQADATPGTSTKKGPHPLCMHARILLRHTMP
jgi:SpoVK/Ycf46/Vps4 family AAA+-type ATPase